MFFKKRIEPAEETSRHQTAPSSPSPLDLLRGRIREAHLPHLVMEAVTGELEKLEKTEPAVAEYSVGFNYIELVLSLPWNVSSQCTFDLERAQRVLDTRHYGLAQVKQRILEFLAAKTLCSKARQSILIVDDEEIARANMEHVLKKEGYACHCASHGAEALEIMAREDIDLIITDLKMERMDGIELLQHVNRTSPEIPVIMVTGFATVSSAVDALKKGAAHYLGKPVNLDELRKTVKEVLEKKLFVQMGKGPILCFTGPPGTGKTSVGKAIAEALQRQFIRISLAGLRDEAELRGHRRTYVGALPGRVITELKRAGVNNPVLMLDEIDKIGQDFRGDPASVLLEVLDPEQNTHFTDHYLELPFDLSRVMFIATANDVSTLPRPLLDRMECIEFSGYTEKEKLHIAQQFILPRQLKLAGLSKFSVAFTSEALSRVINDYTRESGLRNLERQISDICRKIAMMCLKSTSGQEEPGQVDAATVSRLLGPRKFYREAAEAVPQVGVATGMVWAETGGEIISVETARMPGSGTLLLTGSLGEVLRESAQTVLSFLRSKSEAFGIAADFYQHSDLHVHFPSGAIPKDGPSAGVTIFAALLSLLTGRPARRDVAMTGEMTLTGRILPVNGIREKVLAAKRAGVRVVLLPLANREEVEALEGDVVAGVRVLLVANAAELLEPLFAPPGSEEEKTPASGVGMFQTVSLDLAPQRNPVDPENPDRG
ncbi:response regulator receiver protein [Desulfobulbus propionicus DSM 2032]|uniref:endopeptidase La n=1 Tax=Desulfobulbus propionicus (strain ATCC 33891 / DSM 2032 / VKM B-1956 / 1pr3) TaxID=577650 RepID=A0A7U4DP31_DESPD|nr:endopeptidase La [Desulfobulbus propionicus]ADW17632.1 response regulator receiver protein [Desulfobulbus propionicus DSM 2032]